MDKVFIASNNPNKLYEFKEIFKLNNFDIEVVSPADYNDIEEPVEDGSSFEENAYIKAKFYFDKYHLPTIADDSGLCIDFYNGGPGIHSARFLSGMSYTEKNIYIVNEMKDCNQRHAQFVDVICYIDEKGEALYYKGTNDGEIARQLKGTKGFGYDPIFFINEYNATEAELGDEYKNKYSHRAKAIKKWIEYVK